MRKAGIVSFKTATSSETDKAKAAEIARSFDGQNVLICGVPGEVRTHNLPLRRVKQDPSRSITYLIDQ
jgi:hypothetical protein